MVAPMIEPSSPPEPGECKKVRIKNPTSTEPATPSTIVMMHPEGSLREPGMKAFAKIPAIKPTRIHHSQPWETIWFSSFPMTHLSAAAPIESSS